MPAVGRIAGANLPSVHLLFILLCEAGVFGTRYHRSIALAAGQFRLHGVLYMCQRSDCVWVSVDPLSIVHQSELR